MLRFFTWTATCLLVVVPSTYAIDFRTIDGTGNNPNNDEWGSTGEYLMRLTSANYADGVSTVDVSRPNARAISNALFSQPTTLPDARNLSEWGWAWGQFLDHDIDHTLIDSANGTLGITIPSGDPVFDNGTTNLGGQTINVNRASFGTPAGSREQISNISGWIDASMVYGGRATDGPSNVVRDSYLRSGVDGKMKVSNGGALGDMLPKYEHGSSPVMANTVRPTMSGTVLGDKAYVAGDVRANEHSALLGLHTLFVREHNRLADIIGTNNPSMSDEDIYQRARKIVGAEIQAVTYNEFLPSMGIQLGSYGGYDNTVDPTISNEFSTAGFRMGHSQINGTMLRLDSNGQMISDGHLDLAAAFFNPDKIQEGGLEPIFRGLAAQVQEATDAKLVDDLRNQLFQIFIPDFGLVDNATDLAAINILRGRDHGLGTYNEARIALGLSAATSFADMSSDPEVQDALASIYSSVNEVDLYVGMLSEDLLANSCLGELNTAMLTDQFSRLRDGDRFWYANDLAGDNNDLLATANWDGQGVTTAYGFLDGMQLSDILRLNTDIGSEIQDNVFFAQTVPEPSAQLMLVLGLLTLLHFRSQ